MWLYMNPYRAFAPAVCVCLAAFANAEDVIDVKYLGNAGVLISHGETKIVFDPLFDEDFGTYERVPKDIEDALFAGTSPFDGLDAVFVSHHHDDHFSPERMVQLLQARPDLQLFGPRQAIESMPIDGTDAALRNRLHSVTPDPEDEFTLEFDDIEINAVRIPHSGWPSRHADIENISFKVSLDERATVLHMGDAHTDPAFFDKQAEYWAERQLHLALPPYWYFLSNGGRTILDNHIHADEVFGVHVPKDVPDSPSQYPEELRGRTLFSVPGEEIQISIGGAEE
jgi:L-ascorbate metabolism protein UlaG (beta-lactamase superfamily)